MATSDSLGLDAVYGLRAGVCLHGFCHFWSRHLSKIASEMDISLERCFLVSHAWAPQPVSFFEFSAAVPATADST